ncbi:MAG: ABC transporter ATP-binding protein [Deltaproteobacteria bacterium]|nr:ABC transporter ATP-binding protein [Deltaproteobacteria bacterium]
MGNDRLKFTLRFSRAYVAPLWRWYLVGTLALVATNYLSVQVPMHMAAGLDLLRAGQPGASGEAYWIAVLGVLVIVARTLSRVWFFTPGRIAEFNLRGDFFAHLLRLQPDFYARQVTGDLLSRATSDVTYARAFAGFALLQAGNVVGSAVFGVGQMLALSPQLTLAVALPCVLAFGLMQLATRQIMHLQRQMQKHLGLMSDDLLGAFSGVATIQGFNVERVFQSRLDGRAQDLRRTSLAMTRLRAVAFPLLGVAGGVATWGVLFVGGGAVREGTLTAGQLAAFIALVAFIVMPLRMLGWLLPVLQRSEASLERIYAVLDAETLRPGALPSPARAPSIELRGLSFAYGERPVLRDLCTTLPAGATVGIYGPVGSGKSTLLRVLSRLETPARGTVFVDGVDVLDLDLDAYRAALCVVPQAPFLFSETIRENVGFGAPDEQVRGAVAAAALDPDVAALPDGLGTVVGERGIALSGGQRQRVALARALLREAPIVLLDDVLSAVDHATEQELIGTLRSRAGATRVVVSHRLSALVHADFILVLDAGKLVDQGTHDELLSRPGPYREAWLAQQVAA